jgi:hypothetical protein
LHSQDPASSARAKPLLPPLDVAAGADGATTDDDDAPHGQGYGLSPEERRAVETHAEMIATAHFVAAGYAVRRVGKPFDLECTKPNERLRVEVKGTTDSGKCVELTIGEVRHAKTFGRMALFVVSEVQLDPRGHARGGVAWVCDPWRIDAAALAPVRFTYALDRGGGRALLR